MWKSRVFHLLTMTMRTPHPPVETCKLNDVDPLAFLTDALTRIVNGHPNSEIDQLLPWAYRAQPLKTWPENDAYDATILRR
ncbi:hypothetical protein ACVWW5_002692 [Bradyrhizobium sp. LM3.4]